jgi:hypothetical protein
MIIKQFLKPDWRKIVVFVILFLVLPLPWKTNICHIFSIILPSGYSCIEWSIQPFVGFASILIIIFGLFTFDDLMLLIILLLISYLLSCLIILIYNKVKKK